MQALELLETLWSKGAQLRASSFNIMMAELADMKKWREVIKIMALMKVRLHRLSPSDFTVLLFVMNRCCEVDAKVFATINSCCCTEDYSRRDSYGPAAILLSRSLDCVLHLLTPGVQDLPEHGELQLGHHGTRGHRRHA